jgi:hypothetical protein
MASNPVYKKNPAYRSGFNHCTCFAVVKLRGNNEFGWTFGGRGSEENIHLPDSDPRVAYADFGEPKKQLQI